MKKLECSIESYSRVLHVLVLSSPPVNDIESDDVDEEDDEDREDHRTSSYDRNR
jgi:hypothetical protein